MNFSNKDNSDSNFIHSLSVHINVLLNEIAATILKLEHELDHV